MKPKSTRTIAFALLVTAAYYVSGRLGLKLSSLSPSATAVWPPTGIALASVLLLGYRYSAAVFVGAFLVNLSITGFSFTTLGIAIGNTLEALTGAWLLHRFAGGTAVLNRLKNTFLYILLAPILSTMVSATIGVGSLALAGKPTWADFGSVWFTWWLGDANSDLIVAPLILAFSRRSLILWGPGRWFEGILLGGVLVVVSHFVFQSPFAFPFGQHSLEFLLLPLVGWASFRFYQQGAVTAVFLIAVLALWGAQGSTPTPDPRSSHDSLHMLVMFLGTLSIAGLIQGTALLELRRTEEEVRSLNRDLEERVVHHTRERESAYQKLLEAQHVAQIGSWEWEIQPDRIRATDEWYRIYGADPASFRDSYEGFLERIHPEDRKRVDETLQDARRNRRDFNFEHRIVLRGGGIRFVQTRGRSLCDGEGRVVRLIGTEQDVTERKDLERQLLQGQKLQAIGQLAAGIAHEINNPTSFVLSNFTTLDGYCTDLQRYRKAVDLFTEKVRRSGWNENLQQEFDTLRREIKVEFLMEDLQSAIRESREGAERIRDIVKNLKEFSHPASGMLEPTNLNDVVQSAVRLCWNEIKLKAELKESFGTLPTVVCDGRQLEQVIVNLLVNAAQAIPERGTITISTEASDGYVAIRIRDNGVGIHPEHLEKLFEPFFTTKPVGKGTGLGLYVAYRILSAHGGEIRAESTPTDGTAFTLRLPVKGPLRARPS